MTQSKRAITPFEQARGRHVETKLAADFDEESGARAGVNNSQTKPVPGWGLAIKGGEA